MGSIAKAASSLRSTLGPELDAIGRQAGAIRRHRRFSGASSSKTIVLTVMKSPDPTTSEFVATAAQLGVSVTPTAVEKRFTDKLVDHLRMGLEHVLGHAFAAPPAAVPLLKKFTAVEVADSTTVTVPDGYQAESPGCGGETGSGEAAVKIQLAWELLGGRFTRFVVGPGRRGDAKSVAVEDPVAPGSLSIRDPGYSCLKRFRSIAARGAYWISRLRPGTIVFDKDGGPLDLLAFLRERPPGEPVDVSVFLGSTERPPRRLIALRVPEEMADRRRQAAKKKAKDHGRAPAREHLDWCDWTLLVTNCPGDMLTRKEVVVPYRIRWQVELTFKLWKSHGHLAAYRPGWTSAGRMALSWAKLIGVILQQWLVLTSIGADLGHSHRKAARVIRRWIVTLTGALEDIDDLMRNLGAMVATIGTIAKKKRRRKRPGSFQLLLDPELLDWKP